MFLFQFSLFQYEVVHIETGKTERGTIIIVDLLGKELLASNFQNGKADIELFNLIAPGKYLIKIVDDGFNLVEVLKFIKK